jgi:hypothetical protein
MRDSGARRVTPAALFGKLPISFPFGEEPTGGEGADVGEGTELFVGDVDFHSRRLHLDRGRVRRAPLLAQVSDVPSKKPRPSPRHR